MSIQHHIKQLRTLEQKSKTALRLALNTTARDTTSAARKAVRSELNLKASYINQQLKQLQRASTQQLQASVVATKQPVQLGNYGARQLSKKAKHPKRSRGHAVLGIAAGRKAAGVSIKVRRAGTSVKLRSAFLLRLNNGKLLLAQRIGQGRNFKALYGPSVDQHFAVRKHHYQQQAQQQLRQETQRQLTRLGL